MALLLRFFYAIQGYRNPGFIMIVTDIAILSMFVGNLLALRQQNVKRILAYSSIANMGYLLVTLLMGNVLGIRAAIFYITSYIITSLGAFGVITLLSDKQNDADQMDHYKGLFWKRPWVAIVFTLALLSLAGIPLTTGFIAKFYVVFSGIHSNLWLLVISLIINSVIGLYYYLRVITAFFSPADEVKLPSISVAGHIVLAVVAVGILWLGVNPQGFLSLIAHFSALKF
jgi:NADH-quinone oxidoreductase subunit N